MKIVRIFDLPNPSLYAIQYDGEVQDEYYRLFELWNDAEHLFEFFSAHERDLKYFNIDPGNAALQTYQLAERMETAIENACIKGQDEVGQSLQTLFKPLHHHEFSLEVAHQKTKAKRKWLRLYAVRIGPNCFVITGGAIKLTGTMAESPHTQKELRKIDRVVEFLKDEGLYDPTDFQMLEF